jgi:hypothetical protein
VTIPNVEAPYLSTPLLADRTQPGAVAGDPPRLVPTAGRRFAARGQLFCQFEMFGYAGQKLPGVARVTGGYTLTADDGRVVERSLPSPIATDGERVVRRIALPLARLAPGGYTLALEVEDKLSGHRLTAREWFHVEAVDAASFNSSAAAVLRTSPALAGGTPGPENRPGSSSARRGGAPPRYERGAVSGSSCPRTPVSP